MKRFAILFIIICMLACARVWAMPTYDLAYRLGGGGWMMMPDGKVDPFIQRPALGGSFAVEFRSTGRWLSLQQWNNASIGVGARYMNLGNEAKLGSAIAAFGYMNQPFYNGTHFRIGARPTVGLAAVTKTYANTYEGTDLYKDHVGANWSIGSVLNAYLAMELFMDFPIKDGWEITLNGGWHHISNGSIMHPNAGYNLFGGELGLRYHPEVQSKKDVQSDKGQSTKEGNAGLATSAGNERPKVDLSVDKHWAVEISATGGAKQNYYRDNYPEMKFFGAATVKIAAYWVPVAVFRIGAGLDAFYDGYYRCVHKDYAAAYPDAPVTYFSKTYLSESKLSNCFRAGVSIQPEFIIGHLTAGLHVGFYVYDPVKNLEPFQEAKTAAESGEPLHRGLFYSYDFTKASNYQDGWCYMQFVLKYHVLDHLFVQLGLKTHGVRAEFIDAGLGIAF